ncbi:hypothetical protein Pint_05216 [Pistacia integerrima]|uniref:Uncharacterized protein n=1 Tax=Pistacia integerrima TaxID=434235 RepID=A0ACC0Z2B4_9ROSI|nr:hypothetical protein Pint_05216 [Pistacia integerrima]
MLEEAYSISLVMGLLDRYVAIKHHDSDCFTIKCACSSQLMEITFILWPNENKVAGLFIDHFATCCGTNGLKQDIFPSQMLRNLFGTCVMCTNASKRDILPYEMLRVLKGQLGCCICTWHACGRSIVAVTSDHKASCKNTIILFILPEQMSLIIFDGEAFLKRRLVYHAEGEREVKRADCCLTVVVREMTPSEEVEIAQLRVHNFHNSSRGCVCHKRLRQLQIGTAKAKAAAVKSYMAA